MNISDQKTATGDGLAARFRDSDLVPFPLLDLVEAYVSKAEGQRLLLPTIQRSLVWTNEQIVNYWDSLLRGWFPGLMLFHEADEIGNAYDSENKWTRAKTGDLELLDGQQRMAAILLGFGIGPFATTRRLWIALNGKVERDWRLSLRITSPGQPFGYRPDAPNSRVPIEKSRQAWDLWLFGNSIPEEKATPQQIIDAMRARYAKTLAAEPKYKELPEFGATAEDVSNAMLKLRRGAFSLAKGMDLSGASANIFPLAPLLRSRAKTKGTRIWFSDIPDAQKTYELEASEAFEKLIATESANALKEALERALNQTVPIKKLGKELIQRRGDYEEFFKRAGQGGTPLSDDELSYSLIKARIPLARQVLEEIVCDSAIGRLANPTQIALAGLRLARMRIPHDHNNIWERIGRPSPDFVSGLPLGNGQSSWTKVELENGKNMRLAALASMFESMLKSTPNGNRELHSLMLRLRELLGGNSASNGDRNGGTAFPAILLGRLPKEMIDMGLMLVGFDGLSNIEEKARRAFCLWCLTFGDASRTANELALAAVNWNRTEGGAQPHDVLREVIGKLENDGYANLAPTLDDLEKIRKGVPGPRYDDDTEPLLQDRNARFKSNSDDIATRIGLAINDLSFASNHGKNALLYLQRNYLQRHFSTYDPTSDRDEDLPIDLDHIVPHERYGFHWQVSGFPLGQNGETLADEGTLDNLRRQRGELGNLIGNLRWLSSSENRSRGADKSGPGADLLMAGDDLTDSAAGVDVDKPAATFKEAFRNLIDREPKGGLRFGLSGWSLHDIRCWQYLVETRQLDLIRRLIDESGIGELLRENRGYHHRASLN